MIGVLAPVTVRVIESGTDPGVIQLIEIGRGFVDAVIELSHVLFEERVSGSMLKV